MKIGEPFNPRRVFVGLFIPEGLAASPKYSSTSKLAYGHLIRRYGDNGKCWPSARDVAKHIGVQERAAQRALKELQRGDMPLVQANPRRDAKGRQTSNAYVFIWNPLFEGVKSDAPVENDALHPVENDTLPDVKNDEDGGVKNDTRKVSEEKYQKKTLTHSKLARAPLAADRDDISSQRFDEFWELYPRKQKRDAACQEWLSVVNAKNEALVFTCLANYLASDEVSRAVVMNPDKWLYEQYRNGWEGTWPKAAAQQHRSNLQQIMDTI